MTHALVTSARVEARLERLVETDAHEGPVYAADEDALYFTTVPRAGNVAIKRLDLASCEISVVRDHANMANGMTLAPDGRLVVCEQGTLREPARITLVDRATGAAETVVDAIDGRPLNSPNDVVVKSDGTIWFTDPSYGHLQGFRPGPSLPDQVYGYDPGTGDVVVVPHRFDKPNGLAFSPDERVLYVADNGAPHHFLAFPDGRVVATGTPGHPDGLKVDADRRIYASASTGLQVFDPGGELIGEIDLPGAVNFTFGRDALFVTTDDAIWAAYIDPKGARP
jgi:gluconolactonase